MANTDARTPIPPPPPSAQRAPLDRGAAATLAVAAVVLVALVVGLVALASAGSDSPGQDPAPSAQPTTSVDVTAPTTTAPTTTTTEPLEIPASVAEQMYLAVVRDRHGDVWAGTSDADLIGYPTAACTALDAGAPVTAVLEVAESAFTGQNAAAAGFALGAGIEAFCPEYTHLIAAVTP